jgi:ABC-type transport system substrate-binding protein
LTRSAWTRALALAASTALVVGLAACAPTTPVEPSATPREGGTLTVSVGGDPLAIDPALIRSGFGTQMSLLMAETLTTYFYTGELQGLLATDWESNDSGDEWTFHLREGVTFQDGEPFDAEAVKANIDRLLDDSLEVITSNDVGAFTESVEVVDDLTVIFHLTQPVGYFPSALSNQTSAFTSPASWEVAPNTYTDASVVVGTGPYQLVEWVQNDHLTVQRNDDYWGEKAYYQEQVFRFIPDANARETALRAGEIDIATGIPAANLDSLRADPSLAANVTFGTRVNYMAINTVSETQPLLQDERVRQALNYAVDKDAIATNVLFGAGDVNTSPVVNGAEGQCVQDPYSYDPEKAKELLEEAGATDLSITIITPNGRFLQDSQTAEAVAGYLRDVGITVNGPQVQDNAANQAIITEPAAQAATDPMNQLFIWSFGADFPHPSQYFGRQFSSNGGLNFSHYSNPDVDELTLAAAAEPDAEKAAELYCEAQQIVWEAAPHIWLWTAGFIVVSQASVDGITVAPNAQLNTIYAYPAEEE